MHIAVNVRWVAAARKGINTLPDLFGQSENDKTLPYLVTLPNTVTLGIEKKK